MLMFNKEKKIIQTADRIGNLNEELNSLSWGRVEEIALELSENSNNAIRECARELLSIAHANINLHNKLGEFDPQLYYRDAQPSEQSSSVFDEIPVKNTTDDECSVSDIGKPSVCALGAKERSQIDELFKFLDTERNNYVAPSGPNEPYDVHGELLPKSEALDEVEDHSEQTRETPRENDVLDKPSLVEDEQGGSVDETKIPSEQTVRAAQINDAETDALSHFAKIKHISESRDGKLCLFEDADGHLVAVKSSRLV